MAQSDSLREALKHSPDNVPLLLLYAQACLDEWSPGEARAAFESVLEKQPNHPEAVLGLARTLFLEGRASEAVIRLESLLQKVPNFAPTYLLLSRILLSEGNHDEAIERYRTGVHLDKNVIDQPLAKELGIDPSGSNPGGAGQARGALGATGNGSVFPNVPDDGSEDWKTKEPDKLLPIERPDIDFSAVGGMEALKEQIRMKLLYPMQNPDLFRAYGKKIGGGVLLYGPPGCGKTMISRATAGEIKASFFCVGLHDVLDMWIGNSEKNLHELFQLARDNAPSVLFFDEVDALAADRRDLKTSGTRTLINQFLAEMDGGTHVNDGILILGATNAPWTIDPAFRRPGRFDRTIFVPPPDEQARMAILRIMAQDKPVGELDFKALARKTEGFSGADLKAIFERATEEALESAMKEGRIVPISNKGMIQASKDLKPSTKAWFESAKNYALYANQSGFYDDVLVHLGLKKN